MGKLANITAAIAIVGISLFPIASSAAWATVTLIDPEPAANPGQVLINPDMQNACNAAAATHGTNVDGADKWTGTVVLGAVTKTSGPTEVGTHSQANAVGPVTGAGTFTPAHREIQGDPYRNGGSVNMFGLQVAVGGHYSLAQYDFTGTFKTTFDHAFSCDIYKATYHPAVPGAYHPATKVEGYYVNCDFGNGQGNDNANDCSADIALNPPQGSCVAHNNTGSSLPFWGEDKEQCKFIVTKPAQDAYYDPDTPAYYGAAEKQGNEPQTPISKEQTDQLKAHEDADPAGYDESKTLIIGQVVVCISPSKSGTKLPGAWSKQNGYTGDKCNSAWYYGTTPYSPANYAGTNIPNLNPDSNNWVTVPVI